jgi:hypothetical protein
MMMIFSRTLAHFALTCVFATTLTSGSAAAAPSPAPSPAASPSDGACTAPEPDGLSADDAFGHEIDDVRTLAFLSFVENIAPKDRTAVDKRAKAPVAKETTDAFGTALANSCDATEVDYRTIRLVYMLASRWTVDEALANQAAARNAIAALFLGDRIAPAARDAALAVFGTSIAGLDALPARASAMPTPSPAAPGAIACDLPINSKALFAKSPEYPQDAMALGVTGSVQVVVDLDEHGYVRSAKFYNGKFKPDGASGTDLVSASLTAAGSSDYAPEFVRCKPVAGRYIFRAHFTSSR